MMEQKRMMSAFGARFDRTLREAASDGLIAVSMGHTISKDNSSGEDKVLQEFGHKAIRHEFHRDHTCDKVWKQHYGPTTVVVNKIEHEMQKRDDLLLQGVSQTRLERARTVRITNEGTTVNKFQDIDGVEDSRIGRSEFRHARISWSPTRHREDNRSRHRRRMNNLFAGRGRSTSESDGEDLQADEFEWYANKRLDRMEPYEEELRLMELNWYAARSSRYPGCAKHSASSSTETSEDETDEESSAVSDEAESEVSEHSNSDDQEERGGITNLDKPEDRLYGAELLRVHSDQLEGPSQDRKETFGTTPFEYWKLPASISYDLQSPMEPSLHMYEPGKAQGDRFVGTEVLLKGKSKDSSENDDGTEVNDAVNYVRQRRPTEASLWEWNSRKSKRRLFNNPFDSGDEAML